MRPNLLLIFVALVLSATACGPDGGEPTPTPTPTEPAQQRDDVLVVVDLRSIACHNEADLNGGAEPYLWSVFFKVDGETYRLGDDLRLHGRPVVVTTTGDHGDLRGNVGGGETVDIPAALGEYRVTVRSIPVPDAVRGIGTPDLPGVFGVVSVLLEQDGTSDAVASSAHFRFNDAVLAGLNRIVAARSLTDLAVSPAEQERLRDDVTATVVSAIQSGQSGVAALDPDDVIGTSVHFFDQDSFVGNGSVPISAHHHNKGDWELVGQVVGIDVG